MEQQQGIEDCSKNLGAIRRIEQNLLVLQSKIGNLLKIENQTSQSILRAVDSSQSMIRQKISQSDHIKKKAWVSVHRKTNHDPRQKMQVMSKNKSVSIREDEVLKRSDLIREITKKNEEKRLRDIEQLYSAKKEQRQKIKQCEQNSRQKIKQFHLLKQITLKHRKYQIRKQKHSDHETLKCRLQKIISQVRKAEDERNRLEEKIGINRRMLGDVNSVVKYVEDMDERELGFVRGKLGLVGRMSEAKVREVLVYADERIRGRERDKENARPW